MFHRSRMFTAFAAVLALSAVTALPACKTLTNPDNRIAQQIAVQYATGKFIEGEKTVDSRLARARSVAKVAENLKAVTGGGAATIAQLHELAVEKVAKANLTPADRILASTLLDVAVQELSARVTTGVLDPDAVVAVNRLLDWVIAAASAYG